MAHYDTDNTYVFLIIATHEYPQRVRPSLRSRARDLCHTGHETSQVAFKCIGELKAAFVENFGECAPPRASRLCQRALADGHLSLPSWPSECAARRAG